MTDTSDRRITTIATILLSVAALATSWASYQATLWSGDQTAQANQAVALRTRSQEAFAISLTLRTVDVGVWIQWLAAYSGKDTSLANFLAARIRPEFKPAFDGWLASNPRAPEAEPTPFTMPQYRLSSQLEATKLERAADSLLALSDHSNKVGDAYVLDAVLLATVMFFASTVQQTARSRTRILLVSIAGVMFFAAMMRLATSPVG